MAHAGRTGQGATRGIFRMQPVLLPMLAAAGIEKQLALCDSSAPPDWCADDQLVSQLRRALDRLVSVHAVERSLCSV